MYGVPAIRVDILIRNTFKTKRRQMCVNRAETIG